MITRRRAREIRNAIVNARRFERSAPHIGGLASGNLKGLYGRTWLRALGFREDAVEMRAREDGVVRGLLYLMAWFLIAPFAFAALGGALLGVAGVVTGLLVASAIGVVGYWLYLRASERR